MEKSKNVIKKFLKKIWSVFLTKKDFTIISNNCWGGITYTTFDLQYTTPTVGLIIPPKDYNRFCKNLKYYLSISPVELMIHNAKNKELFLALERIHGKLVLGRIDDVEICFIHYKTFNEALEKWERRKKRVNFDNLIFKNNDNNGLTIDDLNEWCKIVQGKQAIFITNNMDYYKIASCKKIIFRKMYLKDFGNVDDTSHFKRDFNLVRILNGVMQ